MKDLQRNLSLYLSRSGWKPNRPPGPAGNLWDHPEHSYSVAVPTEVKEGSLDWRSVTERLAAAEHTTAQQIATNVMLMSTDVANLRAANDIIIQDTIPYEAGMTMMQGAWRMFRTCATTSMRPRAQIRSHYDKRADEIANGARMAHTRRGSFIIPLLLPVSEPVQLEQGLVDVAPPEPVERRVMRTFAEALNTINEVVVQPGREMRPSDMAELVFSGVSAEFASSLHRVLKEEAVAEFSATFEWAPAAGLAPNGPATIAIPSAAAPLISSVVDTLRKAPGTSGIEVLTGPIVSASRYSDGGGTIFIDTVRSSRPAHVGVNLTNDELFDNALEWMKRRVTVVLEGHINRVGGDLMSDRPNGVEPLSARQLPEYE